MNFAYSVNILNNNYKIDNNYFTESFKKNNYIKMN